MHELLKIISALSEKASKPLFTETSQNSKVEIWPVRNPKTSKKRVFGIGLSFILSLLITFGFYFLFSQDKKQIKSVLNSFVNEISGENADLSASPMIPYKNEEAAISLMHPEAWPQYATAEDLDDDPTLVEIFLSIDGEDGYFEGIYLNLHHSSDIAYPQLMEQLKENLSENKFMVVAKSNVKVGGKDAILLETSGGFESGGQTTAIPVFGRIYIVNAGEKYFVIEFDDQASTFDKTYKKFTEVLDSVVFYE